MMREIEETYPYTDENGDPLSEVVRFSPKGFCQRKQKPDGTGWDYNVKGVRKVPYHLDRLRASAEKDYVAFVVEGEKDVHTLEAQGQTATCNPGGAGKWLAEYNDHFSNRFVAIIPDNDAKGRGHALQVARNLLGVASAVVILELPDLPPKGDVTDYFAAGGTIQALADLVRDSPTLTTETLSELAARWAAQDFPENASELTDATGGPPESEVSEISTGHVKITNAQPAGANSPPSTPVLTDAALYGLAGDFVRAIRGSTEAHDAALLFQFLVFLGSILGRFPHWRVEDTKHYTNQNAVLVGRTSKGRKGTSEGRVRKFYSGVDDPWQRRIQSGLSTGEGLIWAVRDPLAGGGQARGRGRSNPEEMEVDPGEPDKRLLVLESEFARVLSAVERQGNTLSPVIRDAWDGKPLAIMTKNSPARCEEPHISIIGHITVEELRRCLSQTEIANGFANRFLFVYVDRARLLPYGGDPVDYGPLQARLAQVIAYAKEPAEMILHEDARERWGQAYAEMAEGHPGLLGAITARAEAHVMRLACLYALLDQATAIHIEHLEAGLAAWQYCEDSARFIFGSAVGDPIADQILSALQKSSGSMTRTEIRGLFGNNRRGEVISAALDILKSQGRIRIEHRETGGRSAEVVCLTTKTT